MPIEDVDYLKDNSTRQSYTFLVDSADRDRQVHPTPSQYTVVFTQPFVSVIGLEVLDASIPRTMYNVDIYNNTLTFFIHDTEYIPNPAQDPGFITVEVTPGDYTIQTLINELNRVLVMYVKGVSISITADHTTNPPELQNTLMFHCPYPFMFNMSRSSIAETLGFDLVIDPAESSKQAVSNEGWKRRRYNTVPGYDINATPAEWLRGNSKLFHSVDAPPSVALGATRTLFNGPRSVNRKLPVSPTAFVAQRFTVTAMGYLTNISIALTTTDASIANKHVNVEIWSGVDIPENRVSGPWSMPLEYADGAYTSTNIPPLYIREGDYWIVIKGFDASNTYVFYSDTKWSNVHTLKVKTGGGAWTAVDTNDVHFEASLRVTLQDPYNYLTAPGMYSLVGERYIILHCPEIEENSYRSLAYGKHNLGLAKFRLGVVGFSENRIDFSKVPVREFHPIGKLSKLSLRFETSGGKLYDFKGINHTITFAIHYLEATQKERFQQSILNPNYQGNYMSYIFDDDQREDSGDEDEYDYNGETHEPDYRLHEVRHLPETIQQIDRQALYQFDE